ncbi:hypothetical protein BDY21DRAFT_355327 [Lineolata rhizophorae]|uniref:Uncharacterized protein n=1 Tax=Lineolata rhizophorae TaxID=578093 RepID=A0A6A6NQ66_9PEZI|nr:hypothetical protein BDY21DRAFT_355327 [Lineolata rhizophorae]
MMNREAFCSPLNTHPPPCRSACQGPCRNPRHCAFCAECPASLGPFCGMLRTKDSRCNWSEWTQMPT